jgi:C-terminal processing protease CtpA/Prc
MKSFLFKRWLKSLAALTLGGLMIATPALGQGDKKSEEPKAPTAEAAKDKAKEKEAPSAPANAGSSDAAKENNNKASDNKASDAKSGDRDKAPTPPSGTTPGSSAGSGNSAGNSGSDKETPRRPDAPPATPATPGNTKASDNQPMRDNPSSRDTQTTRDTQNARDAQPSRDAQPNQNRDDANRNTTNRDTTNRDATNRDATNPNRNPGDVTRDQNTGANRNNRDANTDPNRPNANDSRTTRDERRDNRRDQRAERRDSAQVSTKVRNQAFSTLGLQVNVADRGNGLTLANVQPNSVFYSAGFRTNDVILRVGDRRFTDDVVFYDWLTTVQPNQRIAIVVLRDGREETLYWTPTEQWITEYKTVTQEVAVPGNANALGIYLDPQVQDAAVVADVEPNSAAHQAGVQRNDVVQAVNGERVRSPQDFQALTANVQAAKTELTLSRQMNVQLGAANNQSSSSSTTTIERRDTRVNQAPMPPAPPAATPAPPPATGPAVNPNRPAPANPPRGEGRPGILPRNR